MAEPRFLYITIDGALGHIGFSQVVRLIEGLAARGHRYHLVSLEREADLADAGRVERLRSRLAAVGVGWTYGRYAQGGAGSVVANEAKLAALAAAAVVRERITHIHARGYHAALVAMSLRRPWLFDMRGYWIDERIDEGRWFTTPARVAAARSIERSLIRSASAVVTLTELQADDVRRLGFHAPDRVVAIPTCADYDAFHPATTPPSRLTIGIVGSANRSYLVPETAQLAALILERDPAAIVRVVSGDARPWTDALRDAGAAMDRVETLRVPHEQMPEVLRELSWVLMLLTPETIAKRGSMPTKLGECFASGVRVAAYGCNPEVEGWVSRSGAGVVLESVEPSKLDQAASAMVARPDARALSAAVAGTRGHFALAAGRDRYHKLLDGWVDPSARRPRHSEVVVDLRPVDVG